ncbi:hypothetical protein H4S04_003757 [Coemansia sp. S16]|nr:hypothetical protein H4S04_003757 [Coemansia sp. S16]KAJ2338942.1 hypothetical protein GGH92_006929 [Coemansia sp. RSA 2673]
MTFPSLFQTLPMLVMEKIIEYILERPRNSFDDDIKMYGKEKVFLTPLLSVSELWREAALASICDSCRIGYNGALKAVELKYFALPADFSYSRSRRHNFVKRVVLTAPAWGDMCIHEFSEATAWLQWENPVFPSATTLVLGLQKYPTTLTDPSRLFEPSRVTATDLFFVSSFTHTLQRMVPSLKSLITPVYAANVMTPGYDLLFNTLFAELCQGSVNSLRIYSKVKRERVTLDSMSISGLTCLIQQSNLASAPFAELAYRNAGTLRDLRIRTGTEANWRTMIYGGTQIPTVYSSLALFILGIGNIPSDTTWATIDDVKPFPGLSTLEISEEYPFSDDVLFRGNGATLKSLRVSLRAITKNALGRSGVLHRSGVSRMNTVTIGVLSDSISSYLPNDVIGPQVRRILEMTTTLKLNKDTTNSQVYNAICTASGTATLQHLELASRSFDFDHIIKIVSALPSLLSLTCWVFEIGSQLESIPQDELPSTLHARHYPLSSSLKLLRLSKAEQTSADLIGLVTILMAIMCPSLSHVVPLYPFDCGKVITSAMAKPSYQPYIESLRRLI